MKLLINNLEKEFIPKTYQQYTVVFNRTIFGITSKNVCTGMVYNNVLNRLEGKYVDDYPHVEDLFIYEGINKNIEILAIYTDQEFLYLF